MKRIIVLLLALVLCLSGCKKSEPADIPGAGTLPEGVDWKVWETYMPHTLTMGQERIDVLIALDAIHLSVYYDREEQELLGSLTIYTPLSDVTYSLEHLRILDMNRDGYDDICIPDILTNGDRFIECWLWDPESKGYLYAPEYSQQQEQIGADVSWQADKHFISTVMATPEGPQDLLIWVDEPDIYVYLDQREEQLWGKAQLPEPLSREAKDYLAQFTYAQCQDLNDDGWTDLQLPCRWREDDQDGLYLYNYCWIWDPEIGAYLYDAELSKIPAM